jgi:hypothetical protein
MRVLERLVHRIAVQNDLGPPLGHRFHLDARRGYRHDDGRAAAELLRRERHALRVVAGARRDHAARELRRREARHLVVGAAQLEREHRLQVLSLEQQAIAEPARQAGRHLQRRLLRDVIDARVEDFLEVIDAAHGRSLAQAACGPPPQGEV